MASIFKMISDFLHRIRILFLGCVACYACSPVLKLTGVLIKPVVVLFDIGELHAT
jgi:hypothetical protein